MGDNREQFDVWTWTYNKFVFGKRRLFVDNASSVLCYDNWIFVCNHFFKGKTLLPCIFTHSLFNTLSLFAVNVSQTISIITAVVMMVITVAYSIVLIKLLPKQEQNSNGEQGERDEH